MTPPESDQPVAPTDTGAPHARRPARVLVVDDDPLSRNFQTHLLSLLGHRAREEADPSRAIALALADEFDVVMLDLGMPGLDGFEVLRRIRSREQHEGRLPLTLIAVTGYASDADRQRCLDAGFDEHLGKPIQATSLAAALDRLLGAGAAVPGLQPTDVERLRATVQRLKETRVDGPSFAPTVTESFALRSAQLLETLRGALPGHDLAAVRRASQALKASAEFLGALRLGQMCMTFESQATAGDWTAAGATLRAMNNEHQVVLTLLFETRRG